MLFTSAGYGVYAISAIYQIDERREVPISTEVAVNAIPKGIPPCIEDRSSTLPEVETSRASPAVIQAGARRATRGRIGYSESAVLLHYYNGFNNGYAAVAALAGASFEIVANMTRPDPCAV